MHIGITTVLFLFVTSIQSIYERRIQQQVEDWQQVVNARSERHIARMRQLAEDTEARREQAAKVRPITLYRCKNNSMSASVW